MHGHDAERPIRHRDQLPIYDTPCWKPDIENVVNMVFLLLFVGVSHAPFLVCLSVHVDLLHQQGGEKACATDSDENEPYHAHGKSERFSHFAPKGFWKAGDTRYGRIGYIGASTFDVHVELRRKVFR